MIERIISNDDRENSVKEVVRYLGEDGRIHIVPTDCRVNHLPASGYPVDSIMLRCYD